MKISVVILCAGAFLASGCGSRFSQDSLGASYNGGASLPPTPSPTPTPAPVPPRPTATPLPTPIPSPTPSLGKNFYVSQFGSGSLSGISCSNAFSANWFNTTTNWGLASSQIGPGTTIHLCGTFTGTAGSTILTFRGSGAQGSAIRLYFETGAILTAPYWSPSGGAISLNGFSHILIDGGTNGLITATSNGSGSPNHQNSLGVAGGNPSGNDIEVRNLNITNMYVRSAATDSCQCGVGISIGNGSNTGLFIHDNVIHDAYEGVVLIYGGIASNFKVFNNTIFHASTGIVIGGGNSNVSLATVLVHNNEVYDGVNWDGDWTGLNGCSSDCHFHNQPMHIWAVLAGDSITGLQIYNNYLHGNWGAHDTAWIYPEGIISNHLIYNNVLQNSSSTTGPTNAYIFLKCAAVGCSGAQVYNNTIWSQASPSPTGNGIELEDNEHNAIIKNNIFNNLNYGIYVAPSDTSSIAASDYNLFYPAQTNMFNHVGPVSVTTWASNWGFDTHSLVANPNLTLTYNLSPGSPALQTGEDLTFLGIPMLDLNKAGLQRPPWNMGAY